MKCVACNRKKETPDWEEFCWSCLSNMRDYFENSYPAEFDDAVKYAKKMTKKFGKLT